MNGRQHGPAAPSFREERPDEFQAYVELLASADPAGYAATCRAIADLDIGDHLSRIAVPVLLVAETATASRRRS